MRAPPPTNKATLIAKSWLLICSLIANYPVILRILGFQIAPHLVRKYIIPGSLASLPQYHRVSSTKPSVGFCLPKFEKNIYNSVFDTKLPVPMEGFPMSRCPQRSPPRPGWVPVFGKFLQPQRKSPCEKQGWDSKNAWNGMEFVKRWARRFFFLVRWEKTPSKKSKEGVSGTESLRKKK